MSSNLRNKPGGLVEAFDPHFLYEIDMLEETFILLHTRRLDGVFANSIIESFCIHARNLIEFFDENSSSPAGSRDNRLGAKHFVRGYVSWAQSRPDKILIGRINEQISHLTYNRTSDVQNKIGPAERVLLMRFIDPELKRFGSELREPYKAKWRYVGRSAQFLTGAPLGVSVGTSAVFGSEVSGSTDGNG